MRYNFRTQKNLSVVLVLLGTILMAAAFLYPRMVKPESLWSEKQAKERTEIGYAVHSLAHPHSHDPSQASAIDKHKEEVQKNYERIQAELDEARARPHKIASILKWLGVVFTVLGAGVYYAERGRD